MKCKYCKNEIPDNSIFCMWCGERIVKERKKKDEIKVPKPRQLKSGKWNIQLRAEGESITEDTAELCELKAKAIRAKFIEQKAKVDSVTVGQCVADYIENRANILSPSTIKGYDRIMRTRFIKLQSTNLKNLSPVLVQKYVNEEYAEDDTGKRISAKTLKDAFMLMRSACITKDRQIASVFDGVALPTVQKPIYTVLNLEQVSVLMKAMPDSPCGLFLLIAVWLGLRRSEILALKKSDFDFINNTVKVQSALVEDKQSRYVEKGTKTASSVRIISCPQIIMDMVAELPDGRLYRHSPDYMRRCLRRLCEENNLPLIRFHDLRHINASVMSVTMSDKYSMERGGWASKRTMQGRYQHIFDDERNAADKRVDDYFNNLLTKKNTNENTNEDKKP